MTLVSAGRVGRPHGRDGSFYVDVPDRRLSEGTSVVVRDRALTVERRSGTPERPLVRLSGVDDRSAAASLRGEPILVDDRLAADEWLAGDLVGCCLPGLGRVQRVLAGPSCDVLELDDGSLVPFVSEAIRRVDLERRVIEVDVGFLGIES